MAAETETWWTPAAGFKFKTPLADNLETEMDEIHQWLLAALIEQSGRLPPEEFEKACREAAFAAGAGELGGAPAAVSGAIWGAVCACAGSEQCRTCAEETAKRVDKVISDALQTARKARLREMQKDTARIFGEDVGKPTFNDAPDAGREKAGTIA